MKKQRKAREYFVVLDKDGICYTGLKTLMGAKRKATFLSTRYFADEHEAILVREVLLKRKVAADKFARRKK